MIWKKKKHDDMFIYDDGEKTLNIKYYTKHIVLFIMDCIWKMALIRQPKHREKKYKLSLCGIFKDEAPFLKEWIEYHMIVGVEHFYLYNNFSTDNYKEILKPYIEKGIVTLTEWPVVPAQKQAYRHFLDHYKNETNWVSFLDIDEFMCPLKNDSIPEWLAKFRKYPVVMVYWRFFGSSGKQTHDFSKTVCEQYTQCCYRLLDIGKIFYNIDFPTPLQERMDCIHSQEIKYNGILIPPVNQFGYFVKYGTHRYGNKTEDFQCNHYWSKAYDEFCRKALRPHTVTGESRNDMFDLYNEYEAMNTAQDHAIERFIPAVREVLNRNGQE